jgi:signal peptide peptidase SppA
VCPLKNIALGYVVETEAPEALALAERQYAGATNMTDRMGALSAMVNSYAPGRSPLQQAFDSAVNHVAREQALLLVQQDETVKAIVLDIDSPGGGVTGVEEAGARIRASSKPVIASVSGMAASAAYWLASQARAVYSTESAQTGSIGVYMALLDQSRRMEMEGVRVDLIKSEGSPLKAAGLPGLPLSDEQRANLQAQVDYIYARFTAAVSSTRRRLSADATKGGTFYGSAAKAAGLVDSIADLSTAIRDAAKLAG